MQHQTAFLLNTISAMEATLNNVMMYHRSNPFHLVAFATTATVCTARLLSTKAMWKQMYHSADARANVFNAFALLPTMLLVGKVVAEGIHLHSHAWTWDKVMALLHSEEWLHVLAYGANNTVSVSEKEANLANYLLDNLIMTW